MPYTTPDSNVGLYRIIVEGLQQSRFEIDQILPTCYNFWNMDRCSAIKYLQEMAIAPVFVTVLVVDACTNILSIQQCHQEIPELYAMRSLDHSSQHLGRRIQQIILRDLVFFGRDHLKDLSAETIEASAATCRTFWNEEYCHRVYILERYFLRVKLSTMDDIQKALRVDDMTESPDLVQELAPIQPGFESTCESVWTLRACHLLLDKVENELTALWSEARHGHRSSRASKAVTLAHARGIDFIQEPQSKQNLTATCESTGPSSEVHPTIEARMANVCARKGKVSRTWVDVMLPPRECERFPRTTHERDRCLYVSDEQAPGVIVVYVAFGLSAFCLLVLITIACIRRRRHSMPMLGHNNATHCPPPKYSYRGIGYDGHDSHSVGAMYSPPDMRMTQDGKMDGWTKWLSRKGKREVNRRSL